MIHELEDKDSTQLRFGKYRGQSPLQLAVRDPSYVVWMYRQINPKPCSKALAQDCLLEINARKEAEAERIRNMPVMTTPESAMMWLDHSTGTIRRAPVPRPYTPDF